MSCEYPVVKALNKEIISIEGVGNIHNPNIRQPAFAKAGKAQCGFCTPGMIIHADALLDKNPNHPAGIINNTDKIDAGASLGVLTILAGKDVEGTTTLKMAGDDQTIQCNDTFRFIGNPVIAAITTSEREAETTPSKIKVTYGRA